MNKEELLQRLKKMGFSGKIINAFSDVKREDFIPEEFRSQSYEDTALPIGKGQTISQPYTIAVMLSELDLKSGQNVLEVGSGSGYVLALISEIIGKKGRVFGLEIVKDLAKKSKESLGLGNYKNAGVYARSGFKGLPEKAPFDRIIMSAAVRDIPKSLLKQLKEKGILVAPKGPRFQQDIVVIQKQGDKFITKSEIPGFIFVPFVENK
jgi:protein-L-isoaspartate(D-aspartate) O-methyltransferase